jgi:hypothetical protein
MSTFRKLLAFVFVMLILSASALAAAPHPANAQSISPGCAYLNDPVRDNFDGFGETTPPLEFWAGDSLMVTFNVLGDGVWHTQLVVLEFPAGTVVDSATAPSTLRYTVPAYTAAAIVRWYASTEVPLDWTISCTPSEPPEEPEPSPGCDTLLPITSTAVVGAFVADAEVYWKPGALTNPVITLPADKTAWVLGQDASGAYYKIIWSCAQVWVPKGTMGPDYDDVWNGTPLPTIVIE